MHPDPKPAKRDSLSRVFAFWAKDRKTTMTVQQSDRSKRPRRHRQRGVNGTWKSHYGGRVSGPWGQGKLAENGCKSWRERCVLWV